MAKTFTPTAVASALAQGRQAQIAVIAAVTVWAYQVADVSDMGERLAKQAGYGSLKTWQNYAATCKALAANTSIGVKLDSLLSVATPDNMNAAFGDWLASEATKKRYQLSAEDLANYAKGKPSMYAKKKAQEQKDRDEKAAQKKAEAEADAKANAPTIAAEQQAEQEQAKADAPAVISVPGNVDVPVTPTEPTPASGTLPPAIIVPDTLVFTSHRTSEGSIVCRTIGEVSRAELVAIALYVESMLEQGAQIGTLPVIDPALIAETV